jgi:hypothetical protein
VPNAQAFSNSEIERTDGSTGAFTQHVSLDIPPGRSGLQPDVSLDYNSQRMEDSIVGYGWSLSVPYIERVNKNGSQLLYTTSDNVLPTFTSSIDGELASPATSTGPATISILDSLDTTVHGGTGTSDSFSYTVPSGGTNTLLIVLLGRGSPGVPTVTQNGASATCAELDAGSVQRPIHS